MAIEIEDTLTFSEHGRVEIPEEVCRQFNIEPGTKALMQVTSYGIVLRPITKEAVHAVRGMLKREDEMPMSEWWPAYKEEERRLEREKFDRL
jgi:bifunctional DNA-binding transcriptional regulator/antitoxin component of YhaV-PrlF toxin-antitoxin module